MPKEAAGRYADKTFAAMMMAKVGNNAWELATLVRFNSISSHSYRHDSCTKYFHPSGVRKGLLCPAGYVVGIRCFVYGCGYHLVQTSSRLLSRRVIARLQT